LNQQSIEYLYRLRDECLLLKQCDSVIDYFNSLGDEAKVARISFIKLEHIYYKNDSLYTKTKEQLKNKPEQLKELYFLDKPSEQVVQELVNVVIKNSH